MSILDFLRLTTEQYQAASLDCDLSVGAGAGSGKTLTLAARYLHSAHRAQQRDTDCMPRIVAITFTEKAAREMRNRIRSFVEDWLKKECPSAERAAWKSLADGLEGAQISTIHSLCAAILRAHPAEAQIDPQFTVLDEGDAAALEAQVVEDALAWATGQEELSALFRFYTTGALRDALAYLLSHRLDAGQALDPREAEGKWNDGLAKAIHRFTDDERVVCAVGELRALKRSRKLASDAGPRLAAQVESLLERWKLLERALASDELMAAAAVLFSIRRECLKLGAGSNASAAKRAVRELQGLYDDRVNPWLGGKKSDDPAPDADMETQMRSSMRLLDLLVQYTLKLYKDEKDRQQALDFDDLEEGACELLQNAEVRARWQAQIDALLVDEFQDTNARQMDIILNLAGSKSEAGGRRLFVVGDPKQSIFRFRGADVTVFREVQARIKGRGGRSLSLAQTFRAHKPLIAALNELLASAMGTESDSARPHYIPFQELVSEIEPPSYAWCEPYVEFLYGTGDKLPEARPRAAALLAQRLTALQKDGLKWEEVACLFRASTAFADYEEAFEDAGIPFVTVAGRGFYDRPEIRDLLNILRALADPTDDLAWAGLLRSPAFGVSDAGLYRLRYGKGREAIPFGVALEANLDSLGDRDRAAATLAREAFAEWSRMVDRVSVAEVLKQILVTTGYPAILASVEAGARLQRNVDKLLADAYESGRVRVSEFLEYVQTLKDAGAREGEAPAEAGGSVRLMTIHKAKGLEFPLVVLADATRGRPGLKAQVLLSPRYGACTKPGRGEGTPLSYRLAKADEEDQADAEDARLLYVAATRAEHKLIVCAAASSTKDVWFNKLLDAAGLTAADLTREPGEPVRRTLPKSGLEVGLLCSTESVKATPMERTMPQPEPEHEERPLYEPIRLGLVQNSGEDSKEEEELLRRARRSTTREPEADGAAIGSMFHEAVRRWCFPCSPKLHDLLAVAARENGLAEAEGIDQAIARVTELLTRLEADTTWAEIAATNERWHEVPYHGQFGEWVDSGDIDLLCRRPSGVWRIIDFKTDPLADEAAMHIAAGKYRRQMTRYHRAMRQLLQADAETVICFLDVAGRVVWRVMDLTLADEQELLSG